MRRTVVLLALALVLPVTAAPGALAHPLGNFSINHLSTVAVSSDRVEVRYVLDQAEIPTVEERGLSHEEILARKRHEVAERLLLRVDGRSVPLVPASGGTLSFRPGAGGLPTTRVELPLSARVSRPRRVELHDGTFPGRVGWKAIVSRPGQGTDVRTEAPSGDPTDGLRRYPQDLLSSPLDRRDAAFSVEPGRGELRAPRADGGKLSTTHAAGDGLASVFADAASGKGVLLLLLAAALGWGALHALSPGHGKALVAAYLAGTRGSARHAVALGATVTITHTAGVFALGLVTLALSQYLLPEDLYPWLTLTSGLMVVVIGGGVLRSRIGRARAQRHHHAPEELGWRGLVGMGAAAGLIPCPSALVVLLGALSQHQVGLGLLLIVAFSLGLAGTLTALGLVVVSARRLVPPLDVSGRVASALPALSALLIVGVGCVLTARALPGVV